MKNNSIKIRKIAIFIAVMTVTFFAVSIVTYADEYTDGCGCGNEDSSYPHTPWYETH